ncbi:MAG: DUF4838 domain-containing protein [Kiritimatiellae bacterium]|nr:DUF4838 domain-containing protein [Kiritimatiellia bacterium]
MKTTLDISDALYRKTKTRTAHDMASARKSIAAHVVAVLSALSLTLCAAEIDGSWQIVVPQREPSGISRVLADMARELKAALEEGSGLDLKIVAGGEVGPKRIFFGRTFAEQAGFDLSDYKAMDNAYAERGGSVYLFGNDVSAKGKKPNDNWKNMYLPSVKAATRFMQDVLDVRFLMPGRVGMDVPKLSRVEIKDGVCSVQRPRFDFWYGPDGGMAYSVANGVMMRGTYHSFGGHTWPKAVTMQDFKDRPELFALVGGRRHCGTGGHFGSLCISHPEAEKAVLRVLLEKFDEGAEVVQLAQMDGWNFCECEKCQMAGGLANAEAIGEKVWAFHLGIAEKIRKLRPGKKVWILSYSATFDPPKNIKKFPDNVVVEVAHVSEAQFARWREIDVPGGFTAYIYLWGNYPFMGFTAKRSYNYNAEFARMLLRNRVHGLYRCGYGELFGMEGPANWVFNAVLENPEANVSALVEEFYRRAFGPVAGHMRTFYDTLDKRLRGVNAWEAMNDTGAWSEKEGDLTDAKPRNALDWVAFVYTPEVMKKMEMALASAERAGKADAKIAKRLELVRTEWDYARNLGRIAHLFYAYQLMPSKQTLNPLLDELEARNKMIDSLYDEKGRPKKFPGWPEIRLFGEQKDKGTIKTNGRLRATIGAPLSWDVASLRASDALPGATRRTTVARYCEDEPSFDNFETGAWARVKWQTLGGIQGAKPRCQARFKLLAGPTALYVAAETELPDDVQTTPFEKDGPCWRDESFDLMLGPNGSRTKAYHLVWNPVDGSAYDAAYGHIADPLDPLFGKFDAVWNGNWRIRNARANGVWRTLVTIPYASVGAKGGEGSKWYFNLGRAVNVREKGKSELLLWSPDLETRSMASLDAMGFFRVDK